MEVRGQLLAPATWPWEGTTTQ